MKESVLRWDCEGERVIGILAEPQGRLTDIGLLVIVGGPQYRAGSHRQFTLLARQAAAEGFACLRFDVRGMGDSPGEARDFEAIHEDIGAAIAALLQARPELKRVALWGLCDGASAALLYLQARPDPRVAGLILLNPWARSAATLAQTHVKHYYWRRLRQPEFWRKLLLGGVGVAALRGLVGNLKLARGKAGASGSLCFQDRMAAGLRDFAGPVRLILSGDDYTALEFIGHANQSPAWSGLLTRPGLQRDDLPAADHTFSQSAHQALMFEHSMAALRALGAPAQQEACR